jgi:DNA-binding beta-propeller fold protein YncE
MRYMSAASDLRRRWAAVTLATLLAGMAGCSQAPHGTAKLTLGCSTRVSAGRPIAVSQPPPVQLTARPFAALALPGGGWAVASLTVPTALGARAELAVMTVHGTTGHVVRRVVLPPRLAGAAGLALTHNGQLLLVAAGSATAVLSVPGVEQGSHHMLLGILADAGAGQTEVAMSGDDRYAFVTDETSGELSVFNLGLALRKGFRAHGVAAGTVPLAPGALGVAVAPGGTVYVTTLGGYGDHGILWAVSAQRAEQGAGRSAVLAHAAAGCQPVRVAVSPSGKTIWVTALQSDALLGFAAAPRPESPPALRAVVRVGAEPVGLLLLRNGGTALVGDSNRGLIPGTPNSAEPRISVVSTADALTGHPAVTGSLPAGQFPRDLGYDPATGQVLVPNYLSETVEFLHAPTSP